MLHLHVIFRIFEKSFTCFTRCWRACTCVETPGHIITSADSVCACVRHGQRTPWRTDTWISIVCVRACLCARRKCRQHALRIKHTTRMTNDQKGGGQRCGRRRRRRRGGQSASACERGSNERHSVQFPLYRTEGGCLPARRPPGDWAHVWRSVSVGRPHLSFCPRRAPSDKRVLEVRSHLHMRIKRM